MAAVNVQAHGLPPASGNEPAPTACDNLGIWLNQVKLLLRKNWQTKKRTACGTCCEILLPVVIMLLLIGVRSAFKLQDLPDVNYTEPGPHVDMEPYYLGFGDIYAYERFLYAPSGSRTDRLPRIAFVPDNAFVRELSTYMNDTLQTFCVQLGCQFSVLPPFATQDQLVEYIQSDLYNKPEAEGGLKAIAAAVVFNSMGAAAGVPSTAPGGGVGNNWDYSIRVNFTAISNLDQATDDFTVNYNNVFRKYQESSLSFLQTFVDRFIMNGGVRANATTVNYREVALPMPIPAHRQDDFSSTMSGVIPLFYLLSYLYSCARVVRNIVEEKEQRIKEGMRMMGLMDSAFWTSWFVTYTIMFGITALLITIIGSNTIYEHSDKPLIFFYFWIFGIAMTSFGAAISTFFSKSKIAGTAAYILIFGAYVPTMILGSNGGGATSYSISDLTWAGLLPPTAFGLGSTQIALFEGFQVGVTQTTQYNESGNYKFVISIQMLMIDIFLYGFLSWYLDKVLPQEYGTPLKPWFCFQKQYWTGTVDHHDDAAASLVADQGLAKDAEEPVADDIKKGLAVQVKGLRKVYDDGNVAVAGMTLNMYEGQIFCLLGHNGAGKSTTFSMLTGMTEISSGDAIIDGMSVRREMAAVRQRIGVCPQHDVLFPTLTVREHLELFAALKGVPQHEVEAYVQSSIANVGLTEKEHVQSQELSGGMKRKLSVAIAFAGKSKIVFLDEPTSGMDPYSRRATWDMLSKYKQGRVIVLTTHFMDEADILGDRIAIMGHGQVQCCGSSLFLKALYGVGYTLTFTRDLLGKKPGSGGAAAGAPGADVKLDVVSDSRGTSNSVALSVGAAHHDAANDPLVALIKQRVPQAEKLSSIGAELSYRMPLQASRMFPDMFREVDAHRDYYSVVNYGVSVTTLEEVFLKVGRPDQEKGAKPQSAQAMMAAQTALQQKDGSLTGAEDDELNQALRVEQELARSDSEVCWRHFKALFMKRVHYSKRDKKALCFQLAIPVIFLIFGFAILQIPTNFTFSTTYFDTISYNSPLYMPVNQAMPDYTSQVRDYVASPAPTPNTNLVVQEYSDTSIQTFSEHLLRDRNQFEQSKYFALYYATPQESIAFASQYLWWNRTTLAYTYPPNANGSAPAIPNGPVFNAPNYQYIFYFTNVTAYQGLPTAVNIAHNAMLRNVRGDPTASIRTAVHPMPLTANQQVIVSSLNGFSIAIITVIAFVFIPASYAVFVVREREVKAKHIQTISGVSQLAYWLSTYCWDLVNYMAPFIGSLIVVVAFNNKDFVGDNLGTTVVAFLLYGFSVAPFTYMISFAFKSHSTAQTILILIYFITGLLLLITSFALSLIDSTKSAQADLKFFFRLFPPFCLGDTMVGLATRQLAPFLLNTNGIPGPWTMVISGWNLVYMALEAVIYGAITLVLERLVNLPEMQACVPSPTVEDAPEKEDQDVVAEARRIAAGECKNSAIRIQNLRKVYPGSPPKVAVKNLSYAIEGGQCFGFLGINGAGKTTTLSILSGEFPASSGEAYLMNNSVLTEQERCRRLIGYCPQFDALLDLLTGREHLELFARIKGVREDKIEGMVNTMLKRLTLTEYADRPSGAYSGGNRRKLSVGLALIGNPPIVFLDEPSTGMDPVSRRFMWDFISHTMKGRSVILTTHSMEECEALCHRLGIMVGGRLRCIGSTQHIKDRFGAGYQLDLNIRDELQGMEATKAFVRDAFPGAQLVEFHGSRLKYQLPNMQIPLPTIFERIEQAKERLGVREYSVGQTTLEQIFIEFAKMQQEEKGAIEGFVTGNAVTNKLSPVNLAGNHYGSNGTAAANGNGTGSGHGNGHNGVAFANGNAGAVAVGSAGDQGVMALSYQNPQGLDTGRADGTSSPMGATGVIAPVGVELQQPSQPQMLAGALQPQPSFPTA